MADYKVSDTNLTAVANAIRTKGGTAASLSFPDGFVTAIGNIQTGGSPNLQAKIGITPSSSSQTIPADAGYDGLSSVQIDPIPAQPGMTLIASQEVTTDTTSTSATWLLDIKNLTNIMANNNVVYVKVRDKAGQRAGYFYGSDTFFMKSVLSTPGSLRATYRYTSNNAMDATYSTTGYGVYAYGIYSDGNGQVSIYKRYNSSNSLTVNGTYTIEVYLIDWTL